MGLRVDGSASSRSTPPASAADRLYDVATGVGAYALPLGIGVPALAWLGSAGLARRRRVVATTGAVAAAVLGLAALVAEGARASGASLLSGEAWSLGGTATASHTGAMLALRVAAAVLLLVALLLPALTPWTRWLWALPAAALVLSHAWIGHASVGSGAWWAVPAAFVHVGAMSAWLGGLTVLVVETTAGVRTVPLLPRWSRWAATSVGLIVLTGVLQGVRQIHPLASLWHTTYGLLLVGKVAFVGLAVLTAQAARRELVLRSERTSRLGLPAVLAAEVLMLVVVLGVTATLVAQQPARETYGPTAAVVAPLGENRLQVRIEPTHRGPQQITVRAVSRSGRTVPITSLYGSISTRGLASLKVTFERASDGRWTAQPVVPRSATWRLVLNVGLSDELGYATTVRYKVW